MIDSPPTAAIAGTSTATSNAGTTHTITVEGGTDNNYTFNGTLTINKATITATAESESREYGSPNPTPTISYTEFKNGETAAVLDTQPTVAFAGTATVTANAGTTHAITSSGGTDNNYNFSYENGTLTITKAPLTVTANDLSREYGVANPDPTVTIIGFKNDETVAELDTPPTATIAATATSTTNAGSTHTITPSSGDDNNYTFNYVNGTLTITQAPQAITFTDGGSKYIGDGTFQLSAVSSSGLAVTYSSSDPAVATVADNVMTMHSVGNVTITASQPGDVNHVAAEPIDREFQIVDETRVIGLSTTMLSFGDVIIGRSSTLTLTVTNTGNAELHITGIQHSSQLDINDTDFTVAAGGNVILQIVFTPAAEGLFDEILEIESDATSGASMISVQGNSVLITDAENSQEKMLMVYPNPSSGHVTIRYTGSGEIQKVGITDINGKALSEQIPVKTGPQLYTVGLNEIRAGAYLIRSTTTDGKVYIKKILRK